MKGAETRSNMESRGAHILFLALLGMTFLCWSCGRTGKMNDDFADLILRVDRVISLDPGIGEPADAMAVKDGLILAVGRMEELEPGLKGPDTSLLDLRPGVAVPGLVDAHCHLMSQGLLGLDLLGTRNVGEIQARVAAAVRKARPGKWILGRRWDQNDWPEKRFPDREDLDKVAGRNPVCLTRIDGHAVWVNSLALKLSGIDAETSDPPGGLIHRDPETRAPTGILVDNAIGLVKRPPIDRATRRRAILEAAACCHRYGLTGIHDAGVDGDVVELYRELYGSGELTLRINAMIGGPGALLDHHVAHGPEVGACGGRLTIRTLKLFADGALGSRGAALLKPYSDREGHTGLLVTPPATLHDLVLRAAGAGLQVATHAIGDRANREVLDAYEAAIRQTGNQDARHRLEHAQVLDLEDLPRIAELGVIASMQPTHLTSDMPWARDRLGPDRLRGAYAWRRILDTGAHLAGGSDFPVEEVNPLLGLYSAITRCRTDPPGKGVYGPDQRMTPEEALRAFTIEAAYAAFQEDRSGTLTPGKWADITVLPVDPLRCKPEALLEAEVLATVVAGEVVYRKGQ